MEKISNYIENFIKKVENIDLSFWRGTFLLYVIIFIRTFIENFANSLNRYHLSGVGDTFFHYPLFYFIIFLLTFIIAKILTKEDIAKVAKLVILFSFVLITPPIVDLIVNKGGQIPYIFISGSFSDLFKSFFTYLGGGAVGVGIRTEVAIALSGFGIYIYYKTKEKWRALAGMFFLYLTIFLTLASPSLVLGIQNTFTKEYKSVNLNTAIDFYYHRDQVDSLTSGRTFITDSGSFYSPIVHKMQNQYSVTLAIIFLLITVLLSGWCLFLYSSKKFFTVLKNFRYLRIVHYFLMISVGVYFGSLISNKFPIGSLFDFVSFLALYCAILFAWLFAVWENDEVDIEIDRVSNKERPLVETSVSLSKEEWVNLKYLFLAFSLAFAFLCGLYSFVFILLFIFVYHIYSTPPFHLKRFLGISSLLIAVNALLAVWMGFFMSSGSEDLSVFPLKYTFGILIIFLLVENVKNIKDIEGDRREGVKTIPVIFGEKKGKLIVGACIFLAVLLVPIIFHFSIYTFLAAVLFGIILFSLVNRKDFRENHIFITYFVFILVFFLLAN